MRTRTFVVRAPYNTLLYFLKNAKGKKTAYRAELGDTERYPRKIAGTSPRASTLNGQDHQELWRVCVCESSRGTYRDWVSQAFAAIFHLRQRVVSKTNVGLTGFSTNVSQQLASRENAAIHTAGTVPHTAVHTHCVPPKTKSLRCDRPIKG